MATYRLDIAYDGSSFHGYAKQPTVRTVQGELERALAHFVDHPETFVAGRTDKGVHATGQVASFVTPHELDVAQVMRSLNRQLGPRVAITAIQRVEDDFHARFSATGRRYVYRVLDAPVHDPFVRTIAWHVAASLDVAAMNQGARCLVGEHDFASFCRRSGDRSTVRLVRHAVWRRGGDGLLWFDIAASSFCHQMVRSLVAVLIDVGRGKLVSDDVRSILEAADRSQGRGVAPPHGLTLVEVMYGPTALSPASSHVTST